MQLSPAIDNQRATPPTATLYEFCREPILQVPVKRDAQRELALGIHSHYWLSRRNLLLLHLLKRHPAFDRSSVLSFSTKRRLRDCLFPSRIGSALILLLSICST
ncbi:hypothetical protein A0O28_0056710 [Trichoderma guizhouense]|uniref:Uncharacterized protein n=1 Tax=Trichoderma guizhouense TaxID=1491466 RepID=A0A1T3C670_9HYPO|nr:hypothetical protein A0O28_0056710 [Trichoderma guizhouense]